MNDCRSVQSIGPGALLNRSGVLGLLLVPSNRLLRLHLLPLPLLQFLVLVLLLLWLCSVLWWWLSSAAYVFLLEGSTSASPLRPGRIAPSSDSKARQQGLLHTPEVSGLLCDPMIRGVRDPPAVAIGVEQVAAGQGQDTHSRSGYTAREKKGVCFLCT